MCKAIVALVMVAGLVGAEENREPPSIEYGGNRESSTWVETPIGKVAVDKGVEWQGIKVYLSLTFDLVAVDVKTGKTLWSQMVGAFWTRVGFNLVEVGTGKKTWAVELKAAPRDNLEVDTVQYHDLRTGKKLDIPGLVRKPSGRPFKPRAEWSGATCGVGKPFQALISTAEVWQKVMARISVGLDFGKISFMRSPEKSNPLGAVDNEVVLIVSEGGTWNSRGIAWVESYEDEKRILLRVRHESYQTWGGADAVRPWGVFVLPCRQKAYEVEIDVHEYIGQPPVWKKIFRAARLPDPAKQLEQVPASDNPAKQPADVPKKPAAFPANESKRTDPAIRKTLHTTFADQTDEVLLKLVKENPGLVHEMDSSNCTALHYAARYGRVKTARWLIEQKADVNTVSYNQFTPMHMVSNAALAELLIKSGADLDRTDAWGNTPLQRAAEENQQAVVEAILASGYKPDLRTAIMIEKRDLVKKMLKDDPKLARQPSKVSGLWGDTTPLGLAARHRDKEIVELLLDAGADINEGTFMPNAGGKATALTNAVWAGDKEIVKLLLDRGAETDVTGGKFYPRILDYARKHSAREIVELLEKAAAKGSDRRK